jgi:hypothetical protein
MFEDQLSRTIVLGCLDGHGEYGHQISTVSHTLTLFSHHSHLFTNSSSRPASRSACSFTLPFKVIHVEQLKQLSDALNLNYDVAVTLTQDSVEPLLRWRSFRRLVLSLST